MTKAQMGLQINSLLAM